MATRRNRVAPQQVGLRAPQAATFRAQAVPHIGAQRRSGVGDNARRLAESLGAFNNALRGFGASMDQMMAARTKRNEDVAASFEELGVANEAERQQKIREVGGDPRVDAIFDINYVKNQYIPQRQAEFKAELDGFTANEWSVEEEGPDGEPTRRRMTQADIDQMRYEKNREIEAQYDDKPEYHSIRDALQETVNAEYRATTEAFGAFLNEEANAKANTIVYDNAPATTKALFKATNGDADKMAQALVGESQRLINGELNLKLPRDEIVTSNLKSLQNALTANPEDVELAEAALKLVEGKPHKDTANFLWIQSANAITTLRSSRRSKVSSRTLLTVALCRLWVLRN